MHAVIVNFDYEFQDLDPLFELEDRIDAAVKASGVGEHDGHDMAEDGSDACLFTYGPDADALVAVMRPVLLATPFLRHAVVRLVYGAPSPDTKYVEFELAEEGRPGPS